MLPYQNAGMQHCLREYHVNTNGNGTSGNLSLMTYNYYFCSDPSYESDPSNEYSPLGLTHVMNSTFLDPSNEFLTQAVNIGIPKQTLGLCFHVSK